MVLLGVFAYLGDRKAQQYAASEAWVTHTLNVEVQIARVGGEMTLLPQPGMRPRATLRHWSVLKHLLGS